jgi:sulfatase-modifying factor enzyme 1
VRNGGRRNRPQRVFSAARSRSIQPVSVRGADGPQARAGRHEVVDEYAALGLWLALFSNWNVEEYAHEVGLKKPNPWGLYDVHGNIWEWTDDWYYGSYEAKPLNPVEKVLRGGRRQQERIERALAKRHLTDGTLVLYDISSSYLEGRKCALARYGYSRDHHRPGRPQIVYGLLCDREGRPIAIEVFGGDAADPAIDKLKRRFGLRRVVLVGDRGMITTARIRVNGSSAAKHRMIAVSDNAKARVSVTFKPRMCRPPTS